MLLAGVAWLVESYDVGVIGSVLPSLQKEFQLGAFSVGLLAIASTLGVIPSMSQDMGWRVLFYIGGFPLLFVPALLKWMPESPRWLEVKGRTFEADAIVSKLEHDIERRTGEQLPPPQMEAKGDTGNLDAGANRSTRQRGRYNQIFQGPYLKRTVMMWVAFSCILFIFYAIQTYTPTVLIQQGYASSTAFLLTAIIVVASIPVKYASAFA